MPTPDADGWKWTSFQLRGTSKGEDDCQDFAGSCELPGGGFALAVADGAGSRSRSGEGARAFVTALLDQVAAAAPPAVPRGGLEGLTAQPTVLQDWLASWERCYAEAIAAATARLTRWGDPVEEFAATLVAAIWTAPLLAVMAVGDGFVCASREGVPGRAYLLLPPKREGEAAGSGTHFVSSPSWRANLESFVVVDPAITGVLVSTDGLEEVVVGYAAPSPDGRVGAYAQDVYLVADIFDIARTDGLAAVRPAVNTPKIMDKKGDDVGVAFAVR